MADFVTRLEQACESTQSLVCVGLDPDPKRMPVPSVLEFNRAIVDATKDLVAAYKPNLAFYEAMGLPGLEALAATVEHIRRVAPQAFIIGDAKRGDIGPSGEAYARAAFQVWGFDALTVNAWGGLDTISPFIKDPDHGVFIWCRGSNPGSTDLQDLAVASGDGAKPLYQHLAQLSSAWNELGNIGLVLGATVPAQMEAVRRMCPEMPMLLPGIGAQGGDLEAAVRAGTNSTGRRAVINSSRGIIYASSGPDFAEAARGAATQLRQDINQILAASGNPWGGNA